MATHADRRTILPDRANRQAPSRPGDPSRLQGSVEGVDRPGVERPIGPPDLSDEETLLVVLRGIGAVMFLTTRRVIVARDGVERRPRTGIQSFDLDSIGHLRLELGSAPSGRIALWSRRGTEAVSMFFDARSRDRAQQLIDEARPLVARRQRDRQRSARLDRTRRD